MITTSEQYFITADGYAELTDELEYLSSVGRRRVIDLLREVRQDGDVVDNPALRDALEEQVAIEQRIAFLHHRLAGAQLAPSARDGSAGVGSFVVVRDLESGDIDEYQLVAEIESDVSRRRLSVEAPLGTALLGRRVGDVATIETPIGPRSLDVVDVDGQNRPTA